MAENQIGLREQVSLCETLDRVLNKGVVIKGDIVLSVAGVDLIYLGLHLLLSSVETARKTNATVFPYPEEQHG